MTLTLTTPQRAALSRLIQYNWADEKADYRNHESDGTSHIFHDIVTLDNALSGEDWKVEDYIGPPYTIRELGL